MTSCLQNLARLALCLALASAAVLPARADEPAAPTAADRELFDRQIQPLLKAKCWGCHGEGMELEGQLDLRSRQALLRGGDSGPAVVPGKAADSLLYQAVLRTGE